MFKKLVLITAGVLSPIVSFADNPFFGEGHKNLVFLGVGQGLSTGWLLPNPEDRLVPFGAMHIAYAAPTTFLNLPGRTSINGVVLIGWGTSVDYRRPYPGTDEFPIHWDWREIAKTAQIAYLQQDVSLFWWKDWYAGVGVGIGMQRHENKRIDTKLVFSSRLFAGYSFTDNWHGELFFQHFSNGSTGINFSYNFFGLGVGYSF